MIAFLMAAALALAAPTSSPTPTTGDSLVELGQVCVLLGRLDLAERTFVALLSRDPADARALNGLGNLALLRANCALAERYYAAAARQAAQDAGIRLNHALSLSLGGDSLAALREAARGIALAGGEPEAARLLGLDSLPTSAAPRAGAPSPISPAAIREFLARAAGWVSKVLRRGDRGAPSPADSIGYNLGVAYGDSSDLDSLSVHTRRPGRTPLLRNLITRSSDADPIDLAGTLYWKP